MHQPSASRTRRWLLLAAGLGLAALAQATTRSTRGQRGHTDKGPTETRQERDRRLQRECKGKPNAGACEGYGG